MCPEAELGGVDVLGDGCRRQEGGEMRGFVKGAFATKTLEAGLWSAPSAGMSVSPVGVSAPAWLPARALGREMLSATMRPRGLHKEGSS